MSIEQRPDRRTFSGSDCLLPELHHIGWTQPKSAGNMGLGAHHHDGWEICWLRRGSVDWWAGERVHPVPPQHVYITQPGEVHGGVHSILERCDLFWLVLRTRQGRLPGLSADEDHSLRTGLINLPHRVFPGDPSLTDCWETILAEHQNHGAFALTSARAALHRLLVTVLRCSVRHAAAAPSVEITRSIDHAMNRLDRGVAVAEMAHAAGLSPSRFHARFCDEVGETPADFLRRRRMHHAKHLLATTQRDITDIALSLGFPSSQYFATMFKRYLGMTPRTFRLQARHAPT